MKKISLVFSILLTLLACNSKPDGFVINGTIDGVKDGSKVTLKTVKANKPIEVDTTSVKNGKFSFKGNIEKPDIHIFYIQNVYGNLPFILENKELDFTIYKDSLGSSKIVGSKENDIAQEYLKKYKVITKENNALRLEFKDAQKNKDTSWLRTYNEKKQKLKDKSTQFNINYTKDHSNSLFGMLLLENLMLTNTLSIKEVNEVYKTFPQHIQESASGLRIKGRIDASLSSEEGAIAPDFTAPTPDGSVISLYDIKGKVTIIDFWAAWCGPCRKENPNVVKVYEKYHDKGLEIIGVSLDGNPRQKDAKQEWLNAIEKDGLTWHQVSNLNYFNDPVAKQYNIRSIPATFILDSDGKIVAKNLRGPALEKKIAELLD